MKVTKAESQYIVAAILLLCHSFLFCPFDFVVKNLIYGAYVPL